MGSAEASHSSRETAPLHGEFAMFVHNAVGNRWLDGLQPQRFADTMAAYASFFAGMLIYCKVMADLFSVLAFIVQRKMAGSRLKETPNVRTVVG
jgi:hypothetical protein